MVNALLSGGYQILTYDYSEHIDDQSRTLEDVVSFIAETGARQISSLVRAEVVSHL